MENNVFNYLNTRKKSNISNENNVQNVKKFNFNKKKNNTLKSLSEVECFLKDFSKFKNYIKLYKILK